MVRRALWLAMAAFMALMSWTTPSTSNVPGEAHVWALLGMVSAVGFAVYAVGWRTQVFYIAMAAWFVHGVPRGVAWALDEIWAPAAIWGGWTATMVLLWLDRSQQAEM